jgi:phospholipid:diacylglycerol acyltransferase
MWIKGGNAVWGDATFAPDDEGEGQHTHGELISFRQTAPIPLDDKDVETPPSTQGQAKIATVEGPDKRNVPPMWKNMTVDEAGNWILAHTPLTFRVTPSPFLTLCDTHTLQKMIATNYSYGIERDEEVLKRNDLDHTKWTNPLEIRYVTVRKL